MEVNSFDKVDWDFVTKILYSEELPVLAVIGNPPRSVPDEVKDWTTDIEPIGEIVFKYSNGTTVYRYMPDAWKLEDTGDLTLTYAGEGNFEITIPYDQYERVHLVNPFGEVSDAVLMERSNCKVTNSYRFPD